MTSANPLRVSVIGASGIGRHHANWWRLEGADVCSFVGTTAESIAKTAAMLQETFGIHARGYTDVAEMLKEEKPHIVDVCSPPSCHYSHVRAALEAGCHVLCEKPFVYETGATRDDVLKRARELVELASGRKLRLGVCTQYSAGATILKRLLTEWAGQCKISAYCGHLESPAKGRSPDPVRVWVDLSPHPISVFLHLFREWEIDWDTVKAHFEGYTAEAKFIARQGTDELRVKLITRNALEPPLNVREFILNDFVFRVEGERDENGVYRARIDSGDTSCPCDDFMRLLIREFISGHVITDGETAIRNLDIMMRIIELSRNNNTSC